EPGSPDLHGEGRVESRGRCAASRAARSLSHRHPESLLDAAGRGPLERRAPHRRGRAGPLQLPDRPRHRGDPPASAAHAGRRARGTPRWLRRRAADGVAGRAGGEQRCGDRAAASRAATRGALAQRRTLALLHLHAAHARSPVGDRLGAALAMNAPDALTLLAPLAGWTTPLDEAPDEVFAARLLGDGVAIDPTAGTLYAP